MARMQIIFDGFEKMAERMKPETLKSAVNEALTETQKYIQSNVRKASEPYKSKSDAHPYVTGRMYKSILEDEQVQWESTIASIRVGFNLGDKKGGFHSIFLMYGTPKKNKKKEKKKDIALFNAIRGAKTKKEIAEIQKRIMERYLS